MPTYVYRCQSCDRLTEIIQKLSDAPLTTCEVCGGELRKVIHPVGIVFKGSGYYVTDHGKKGGSSSSSSSSSTPQTGSGSGSDASSSGGSDSKSASTGSSESSGGSTKAGGSAAK